MDKKLDLQRMKKALRTHHGGPGPHKSGSPQSVHGGGRSKKGEAGSVPGWSVGSDLKAANEFVKARARVPKDKQPYLSQYTAEELVKNGGRIFVAEDGMSGFVVAPDGDIQNVFSANHRGKDSLRTAIKNGGKKLDCFDGFLPKYYSQFGFEEYKREANWTPGGPDVVFMRLP